MRSIALPSLETTMSHHASISHIIQIPNQDAIYLVCPRGPALVIINEQGHIIKTFQISSLKKSSDFVTCTVSPGGHYIYAVNEDHQAVVFNVSTAQVEHTWKIHDSEVIGIVHHPTRHLLLTHAQDGLVRFWKSL
jgi:WD40 repeat protein